MEPPAPTTDSGASHAGPPPAATSPLPVSAPPPAPADPGLAPRGLAAPPVSATPPLARLPLGLDRRTFSVYAACGAVFIGALGPWGTAFGLVSVSGVELGDGYIFIVCAGLIAAMWGLKVPVVGRVRRIALALCGLLIAATGTYYIVSYAGTEDAAVGWGLLLGTLAGWALVVLVVRRDTRQRQL